MLNPIYPGNLYDRAELATAGKTRVNYDASDLVHGIAATTKTGPLAGLVAKFSASYEVDYCLTGKPAGIFANNYDRGDVLPSPGKTVVGKAPIYTSGAFETDIYDLQTYAVGDWLYVDATRSVLTNAQPSGTNWAIGYVTKTPTDGWLGFNMVHPTIIA